MAPVHQVLPMLCITFKRSENCRKYIVCVAQRRSSRGPPRRGVLPLRGTLLSVPFPTAPHQIRHIVSSASYPYCNNLILPVPYCIISYCINPPLHNSLFLLPTSSAQSPTATISYCITSCQQPPGGPFFRHEENRRGYRRISFTRRERPFEALYGAFPPEVKTPHRQEATLRNHTLPCVVPWTEADICAERTKSRRLFHYLIYPRPKAEGLIS